MRSDENQIKTLRVLLDNRKIKLSKDLQKRLQGERRNENSIKIFKDQVQALEWAIERLDPNILANKLRETHEQSNHS